jgi:hypothetical protein
MPKSRRRKQTRKAKGIRRHTRVTLLSSVLRKIRGQLTFGKVIAITISIIGLISAYVTIFGYLSPRISVQPLTNMNPKDATSTEFSITNQGTMDIYDVAVGCRFMNFYIRYYSPGTVAIRKAQPNETKEPEIGDIHEIAPIDGYYHNIPPMRSGTMKVPLSMPEEQNLDIEIVVNYRPAWYPFARQESFRFITKVASDGQIYWLPRPDSAPDLYKPAPPKN